MKYYIESIEQTLIDGVLNEYGGTEKVGEYSSAESKYYKKLSDVAADIGKNHAFMTIVLKNSLGTVLKSDKVGEYTEEVTEES